jgi:outer membrane biosynthesis protein TonB
MERRAASHTEEEEMNHRRRLLNAAKKGDQKAIGKLLELYQVRIYSGDMVTKMNKTSATHKLQAQLAEGKPVRGGSGSHGKKTAPAKPAPAKRTSPKAGERPAISKIQARPKAKPKPTVKVKVKIKQKPTPKSKPRSAKVAAKKRKK